MNIDNTPLAAEIDPFVARSSQTSPFIELSCLLTAGKHTFVPIKILSKSEVVQYTKKFTAHLVVRFVIGLGDYTNRVYPNQRNLSVMLQTKVPGKTTIQRKYVAFMDASKSPQVPMSKTAYIDNDTLNTGDTVDIELQLLDYDAWSLMNILVGRAYQDMAPIAMAERILGEFLEGTGIQGVVSEPATNTVVRRNTVVPSDIRLIDIVDVAQDRLGGIYDTGAGLFIHTDTNNVKNWCIYPLYDLTRFEKSKNRAVIVMAPENRFVGSECTWIVQDSVTKIMITGSRSYSDQGDNQFMNQGIGYKKLVPSALMDKPVRVDGKNPIAVGHEMIIEEETRSESNRVNFRPMSKNPISDNIYVDRTELKKRSVAVLLVEWENSNSDLLSPCMPCRIITMIGGDMVALSGVVAEFESYAYPTSNALGSRSYAQTTMIKLLVNRDVFSRYSDSLNLSDAVEGQL